MDDLEKIVDLEKITDFIQKYAPDYKDRETIKEYVQLHLQYKTAFIGSDTNGDIIFVCRWNMSKSNTVAHVLDFYVREDYRNNKLIQLLLYKARFLYPTLKYITFERESKYPGREQKMYSMEKILKRRNK